MTRILPIVLVLGFGAHSAIAAALLQPITDSRTVASGGSASTQTLREFSDGSPSVFTTATANKPLTTSVHPVDSFGLFYTAQGLGLRTESATLDGQGAQYSTFNGNGFSFDGLADVFATASTTTNFDPDYTETITGSAFGSAGSRARWTFSVLSPILVLFTGNHNFYSARGGFGEYSFTGSDGFVADDGGASSFALSFLLSTDVTYTFDTQLSASVSAMGDESRDGRVTANFQLMLAPVPEPGSLAMVSLGLALLLLGGGKLRSRKNGSSI